MRRTPKRFGANDETKPVSNPLTPHFNLNANMSPTNDAKRDNMKKVPYANVVGSLMYATVCTRPDICHAIGR